MVIFLINPEPSCINPEPPQLIRIVEIIRFGAHRSGIYRPWDIEYKGSKTTRKKCTGIVQRGNLSLCSVVVFLWIYGYFFTEF
jgi:hypothetical protein